MSSLFKIKICGVTSVSDAMMISDAGADAIGLNFYDQSTRHVSHLDANFICRDIPSSVKRVGVFVNAPVDEVRLTAEQLLLDFVQLHGDESLEYIQQLEGLAVIRALRMRRGGNQEIEEQVSQLQLHTPNVRAILLDAYDKDHYGGTGKKVDWHRVTELTCFNELPLILAGGLNPETINQAITTVRPAAVDVASGVESIPGKKDPAQVKQFVRRGLSAFKNC